MNRGPPPGDAPTINPRELILPQASDRQAHDTPGIMPQDTPNAVDGVPNAIPQGHTNASSCKPSHAAPGSMLHSNAGALPALSLEYIDPRLRDNANNESAGMPPNNTATMPQPIPQAPAGQGSGRGTQRFYRQWNARRSPSPPLPGHNPFSAPQPPVNPVSQRNANIRRGRGSNKTSGNNPFVATSQPTRQAAAGTPSHGQVLALPRLPSRNQSGYRPIQPRPQPQFQPGHQARGQQPLQPVPQPQPQGIDRPLLHPPQPAPQGSYFHHYPQPRPQQLAYEQFPQQFPQQPPPPQPQPQPYPQAQPDWDQCGECEALVNEFRNCLTVELYRNDEQVLYDFAEVGEQPSEVFRVECERADYQIVLYAAKLVNNAAFDPSNDPFWDSLLGVARLGVNAGTHYITLAFPYHPQHIMVARFMRVHGLPAGEGEMSEANVVSNEEYWSP
ncbi:hypothetical protein F4820DRAFT_450192 [Hypoxylon rubiginosum]|uniref:Uncharacterized protein n=1 Tax=Hypoxylon rubiginosum TaxID=110542 RepID=A0ACB9YVK6_9PEZI|nr:hypothetical protein F4820DRAFT_450192 [Hypoxylon rubiginosum]